MKSLIFCQLLTLPSLYDFISSLAPIDFHCLHTKSLKHSKYLSWASHTIFAFLHKRIWPANLGSKLVGNQAHQNKHHTICWWPTKLVSQNIEIWPYNNNDICRISVFYIDIGIKKYIFVFTVGVLRVLVLQKIFGQNQHAGIQSRYCSSVFMHTSSLCFIVRFARNGQDSTSH